MKETYFLLRFTWSVKALWKGKMNIEVYSFSTSLHYIFGALKYTYSQMYKPNNTAGKGFRYFRTHLFSYFLLMSKQSP